jgi:hypothetical protein
MLTIAEMSSLKDSFIGTAGEDAANRWYLTLSDTDIGVDHVTMAYTRR